MPEPEIGKAQTYLRAELTDEYGQEPSSVRGPDQPADHGDLKDDLDFWKELLDAIKQYEKDLGEMIPNE